MKLLCVSVLGLGLTASAFSAVDTFGADRIVFQSLKQTNNGSIRTLEGSVRIETPNVIIQADKATFKWDTFDIEPTGNVHITLKRQ